MPGAAEILGRALEARVSMSGRSLREVVSRRAAKGGASRVEEEESGGLPFGMETLVEKIKRERAEELARKMSCQQEISKMAAAGALMGLGRGLKYLGKGMLGMGTKTQKLTGVTGWGALAAGQGAAKAPKTLPGVPSFKGAGDDLMDRVQTHIKESGASGGVARAIQGDKWLRAGFTARSRKIPAQASGKAPMAAEGSGSGAHIARRSV